MIIELLLLAVVILIVSAVLKARKTRKNEVNVPTLPFFESVYGIFARKLLPEILFSFVLQNRVSGFYGAWLFGRKFYVASDPESAQFVLGAKEDVVVKFLGGQPKSMQQFSTGDIVRATGETWRRQRQVYNPAFNMAAYKSYFESFSSTVDKCVSKIEESSRVDGINGKPCDVDMAPWMSKMTLDVLGKSIFNYDFGNLDGKIDKYYDAYQNVFNFNLWRLLCAICPALDSLPVPPAEKLRRSVKQLQELFDTMIKENKDDIRGSMLTRMLDAVHHQNDSKVYLSEQEFQSNLFILFVAGHETTSAALSWILFELAKNPKIQDKVFAEIQDVLGDKPAAFEDLDKLTYLDNVITETLRLHPPVTLLPTRITVQDLHYKNQVIPKDSTIGLDIFTIHHHPLHYSDPFQFNPDRWNDENHEKQHRFAYLPFSLGPRMCIGNTFSLIEQRLFLSRFLQKFEVTLPKDHVLSSTRGNALNSPAHVWVSMVPRKTEKN